jgi:hypothetical protein
VTPEDISKAAWSAFEGFRSSFDPFHGHSHDAAVEAISKAILSERHRCAVIARNWQPSSFQDEYYAANSIADKIMAGER